MKIIINNKEIQYFIIDDKGTIKKTGEEEGLETFQFAVMDLDSIKVGEYPKICFNPKQKGRYADLSTIKNELKFLKTKPKVVWTELNYKIIKIEKA